MPSLGPQEWAFVAGAFVVGVAAMFAATRMDTEYPGGSNIRPWNFKPVKAMVETFCGKFEEAPAPGAQ